jgi:glutathionylspermidine synthase
MSQSTAIKIERLTSSVALGRPLAVQDLRSIERSLNLRHGKWDTRVGGRSVLSSEPLLIPADEWNWLCSQAETAAQELFAVEPELASDKNLLKLIGVPRNLWDLIKADDFGNRLRTLRFDFHPTGTGWVMSEVNSDVPGGFGEASFLPDLYKRYVEEVSLTTAPLSIWGDALQSELGYGTVALLYAPGFLEDEQVIRVMEHALRSRGFESHLIQSPSALEWHQDFASLRIDNRIRIDAVIRFYQVEWISQLPSRAGWKNLLKSGSRTRVMNPTISAISESKRLALCLKHLTTRSETFGALSPECREPCGIEGSPKEDWVLKATYSNTGDEVHLGGEMSFEDWSRLLRRAKRDPHGWVAQRRFETLTLESAVGPVKPCVGVFVIAGRAAGAYVRLSRTQVTNAYALEAPLFIMTPKENR